MVAESQVASAQATLTELLNGPTEAEVREVELSIEQVQLDLEAAQADLDKAELRATIDGIVLSVDVEVGQKTTSDLSSALIIGDLTKLELPVFVAEVDINKVEQGQPVNISVDALPDQPAQQRILLFEQHLDFAAWMLEKYKINNTCKTLAFIKVAINMSPAQKVTTT